QRAVGQDEHVGRPSGCATALQPPRGEWLIRSRASALDLDERDAVADRRRPVPGAVLGDEDATPVALWKHLPGVEAHAEGRHVRAKEPGWRGELRARAPRVVLGVAQAVAVTEGKAEVLARAREAVQLVGRLVVAEPVAPVVGEPELAGLRLEVEADAVAHAARDHLGTAARNIELRDGRMQQTGRRADVARRADGHVETTVRTERDELPAVVSVGRVGVADHLGLWRLLQ